RGAATGSAGRDALGKPRGGCAQYTVFIYSTQTNHELPAPSNAAGTLTDIPILSAPPNPNEGHSMIKVSVIYPRSEGSHFDADYYAQKHLPMAKAMFGDLCQRVELQVAVSDSQPFHAVGEMVFESVDAMKQAFKPNIKALH